MYVCICIYRDLVEKEEEEETYSPFSLFLFLLITLTPMLTKIGLK